MDWPVYFMLFVVLVGILFLVFKHIKHDIEKESAMAHAWHNFTKSDTLSPGRQRIHLGHVIGLMDSDKLEGGTMIRLTNGNLVEVTERFDDVVAIVDAYHRFCMDEKLK